MPSSPSDIDPPVILVLPYITLKGRFDIGLPSNWTGDFFCYTPSFFPWSVLLLFEVGKEFDFTVAFRPTLFNVIAHAHGDCTIESVLVLFPVSLCSTIVLVSLSLAGGVDYF